MLVRPHNRAVEKYFLKVRIFAKRACQTPLSAQREKRLNAVFHGPKSDGRSRQGAPVLAIQRTASTNKRLSAPLRPRPPALPCSIGSICNLWSSRNSNLGIPSSIQKTGCKHNQPFVNSPLITNAQTTESSTLNSPTLNKRELQTELNISNGDVIVLAGLDVDEDTGTDRRFFGFAVGKSGARSHRQTILLLEVQRL